MPSYQSVDVYVYDNLTREMPLPNVLVRVLSADGTEIFTQGTTDAAGHVGFLLWTNAYSLRFYRYQTVFSMPQTIVVQEGVGGTPVPNAFNVYGEVAVPPIANDPNLCRASGFFRDITGAPKRWLEIILIGEFAPILLDRSGVLSERTAVRTDEQGYACLDLIRCAKYAVTIQGYEDQTRSISVPDAPNVNLPDLLFPTVASVSFDHPSPWTLSVGKEICLKPTVITTSKVVTHGTDTVNVQWIVTDPHAVRMTIERHHLRLKGIQKGCARLIAKQWDKSVVQIPYPLVISGSGQLIQVQ